MIASEIRNCNSLRCPAYHCCWLYLDQCASKSQEVFECYGNYGEDSSNIKMKRLQGSDAGDEQMF